jgi:hypothetical protein
MIGQIGIPIFTDFSGMEGDDSRPAVEEKGFVKISLMEAYPEPNSPVFFFSFLWPGCHCCLQTGT